MNKIILPDKFKPVFWDTPFEDLDTEKDKAFIIIRMYCYGGIEGMYWVERHYSDEDIITAAKTRRDMNPIVANHLKNKFGLEKFQMKYYTQSFDWRHDAF